MKVSLMWNLTALDMQVLTYASIKWYLEGCSACLNAPLAILNLHLLVSCARRTFSDENVSSRSNRSSMGGGKSFKAGGKTWKTGQHLLLASNLWDFKQKCYLKISVKSFVQKNPRGKKKNSQQAEAEAEEFQTAVQSAAAAQLSH